MMRAFFGLLAVSAAGSCGGGPVAGSGGGGAGAGGDGGAGGAAGGGGVAAAYPDVARVDIPSSFIAVGDGSYRFDGGLEVLDVTQAFYGAHGDDYDFVIIYTDFLIQEIWQFELTTTAATTILLWKVVPVFAGIFMDAGMALPMPWAAMRQSLSTARMVSMRHCIWP